MEREPRRQVVIPKYVGHPSFMRKRKKAHLLRDDDSDDSDDSGNEDEFKDCLDEKDGGGSGGGALGHGKEKYPILMSKMNRLDKLMRAYRGIKDVSEGGVGVGVRDGKGGEIEVDGDR